MTASSKESACFFLNGFNLFQQGYYAPTETIAGLKTRSWILQPDSCSFLPHFFKQFHALPRLNPSLDEIINYQSTSYMVIIFINGSL